MIHDTITLDCDVLGYLDLDVSYEEVIEDNSFDHEFGTEVHIDRYAVVHNVNFNGKPLELTGKQFEELESFITENLIETTGD